MHDHKLGETVILTVAFVDKNNQAFAATGVSVRAKRPDGSVVDGTVTPGAGTGQFEARFLVDAAGTWLAKAECTGPEVVKDETRFTVSRLLWDSP